MGDKFSDATLWDLSTSSLAGCSCRRSEWATFTFRGSSEEWQWQSFGLALYFGVQLRWKNDYNHGILTSISWEIPLYLW